MCLCCCPTLGLDQKSAWDYVATEKKVMLQPHQLWNSQMERDSLFSGEKNPGLFIITILCLSPVTCLQNEQAGGIQVFLVEAGTEMKHYPLQETHGAHIEY